MARFVITVLAHLNRQIVVEVDGAPEFPAIGGAAFAEADRLAVDKVRTELAAFGETSC